mmetsp:Transcript_83077/g.201348  ORF Transcript_83077/g.201348 Transcript_83077/m.201348 type:complete len:84 (-) Transcript_83077:86-337(-)
MPRFYSPSEKQAMLMRYLRRGGQAARHLLIRQAASGLSFPVHGCPFAPDEVLEAVARYPSSATTSKVTLREPLADTELGLLAG